MTLREAIIEMPVTGVCKLNINKVKQLFDASCFISRWHDEFKLVQVGQSDEFIKILISRDDALEIINDLNLEKVESGIFKNGSTYRSKIQEKNIATIGGAKPKSVYCHRNQKG